MVLTADIDMKAKLVDLATASEELKKVMSILTAQPGCSVYPEACSTDVVNYDRSIDIFPHNLENFPGNPLPSTYTENSILVARSELDRREEYTKDVEEKLSASDRGPPSPVADTELPGEQPSQQARYSCSYAPSGEAVWEKERELEQVGPLFPVRRKE